MSSGRVTSTLRLDASRAWLTGTLLFVALGAVLRPASSAAAVSEIWRGPTGGMTFALAVDPARPGRVLAGTARGGVFESRDAGRTWRTLGRPLESGDRDQRITALAVDAGARRSPSVNGENAAAASIVYAGVAGGGLWRRRDDRRDWESVPSLLGRTVRSLALDTREDGGRVLYAGTADGELFESADGENWMAIAADFAGDALRSVVVDRRAGSAVTYVATGKAVYRRSGEDAPFARVSTLDALQLALLATRPGTILAGVPKGVFRSTDRGESWEKLEGVGRFWALLVDPATRDDTLFLATAYRSVLKSSDAGGSWVEAHSGLPRWAEVLALAGDANTKPPTLYAATSHGGVHRSADGGASWRADEGEAAGASTDHGRFERSERFKVLVLGVDGATWRVVDPLLKAGKLPAIARIIEQGVRAPLRSRIDLWSPAIWTTIATGVRRERHAITNFLNPAGALVGSIDRKAPSLWTVASAAGLRSALVGWWVTYPAEHIDGVVISERAFQSRDDDLRALVDLPDDRALDSQLTYPPETLRKMAEVMGQLPRRPAEAAVREATVSRMRTEDAAAIHLLERIRQDSGPFDLEMVLLRGVDPVSHYFWRFYEPGASVYEDAEPLPPADEERFGSAVADHYRYVDGLLGALEASRGPRDVWMIVSDHGFEASPDPVLTGTHQTHRALDGILLARGGPLKSGVALDRATILDVAPTVLYLLGLPVPSDMEGRVLTEAIEADWLEAHPVRTTDRSTAPPVLLPPDVLSVPAESSADAPFREQLKALGYVD